MATDHDKPEASLVGPAGDGRAGLGPTGHRLKSNRPGGPDARFQDLSKIEITPDR